MNLTKPLSDYNENFRSIRLRLWIVNKDRSNDELDTTIFDHYITKLEQAAAREKTRRPASIVYSACVHWAIVNMMRPTLSEAMTFCSKIDHIHNHHTTLSREGTCLPSETLKPLPTSEGGDAMDLNDINSRGGGNCRGRGSGRAAGRERHGGGENKMEASNAEPKQSRNRTSPTPTKT